MKYIFFLAMVVILGTQVHWVFAVPISVDISGEIFDVEDPQNILVSLFNVGDTVTGTYTYESTTVDTASDNPNLGSYQHSAPPYGITLHVGGYSFWTDPDNVNFWVWIFDETPVDYDAYSVHSHYNISSVPLIYHLIEIDWTLYGGKTGITGDALPTIAPTLTDFTDDLLDIHIIGAPSPDSAHIYAHVTSATLSGGQEPIPEPSTILLLTTGLFGMAAYGFRRRKKS